MRKRIAALICVMLLCMSSAFAGSYTAKDGGALFTLRYDEKQFALDQYSYLGSSMNGTWFFILYDAQYTIDCGAEYTDRGGMTDGYAQAVCQAVDGKMVEMYEAGGREFVIVSAQRQDVGQVYYAETVVGGRAVYFEIYDMRTGVAGEACLQTLKTVLDGFMPLQ